MPHTPAHCIGSPFIELLSVDSTNNYARQLLQGFNMTDQAVNQTGQPVFAQHGTAIFAHEQLAGKGQRGKTWVSEKGANIALSIIIDTQALHISQQFQLSACVAVVVHEFFIKYAHDETTIKWPNDLYWKDRKAGGILIESIINTGEADKGNNAKWTWAIVGMGLNINQTSFSPELPNPVSLKQITGKTFDTVALAKELCTILNEKFALLLTGDFESIYQQYLQHLYKKNEPVKLKKENRVFEAVIKTVLPNGRLTVQHAIEEEFDFGEVEWIIK